MTNSPQNQENHKPQIISPPSKNSTLFKSIMKWGIGIFLVSALAMTLFIATLFAVAQNNLPSIQSVTSYKPKMPLRIYTADNYLIGEFGEERREFVPIEKMPKIMQNAIVAIEDERFYQHNGVDLFGVVRAFASNIRGGHGQGASTITMQVARNFFLSNERTFTRKIYEMLLAYKIEANMSKDKILELYMNQIYLGQRSHGFAAASKVYFGKSISEITIAEAAMLAGLPKAPSAYNPVVNPKRAKIRQEYILKRMMEQNYITQSQYQSALQEKLNIRSSSALTYDVDAPYVAEQVRNMLYEQFKDSIYNQGLSVYTTIVRDEQEAAMESVQKGIKEYDKRQGYRGPEGFINLPEDPDAREEAISEALLEHPDVHNYISAIVLSANSKAIKAIRLNGEIISLTGESIRLVLPALSNNAVAKIKIKSGSIIRITYDNNRFIASQLPEVESAFVAIDSRDGAIRSMVGGFDFSRNKFNRVTQAWRQPGSSFKPFIYSASLEKGFSPSTVINDGPLSLPGSETGGEPWEPKNYEGTFDGPMTMRRALAKSKNLVSIRILRTITPQYARKFITKFGFPPEKHPAVLPMALGVGSATPLQMAVGYSVFANGGYRVDPYLIKKVVDSDGNIIRIAKPHMAGDESIRTLNDRNAYIMDSMLKEVATTGTAASARQKIKRPDIGGKTGTTNSSYDAWFAGYGGNIVAIAWMGYDKPHSLGAKETGGGLALPIWIRYMQTALKNQPIVERKQPAGVVDSGGDLIYNEYEENDTGVKMLDTEPVATPTSRSKNNDDEPSTSSRKPEIESVEPSVPIDPIQSIIDLENNMRRTSPQKKENNNSNKSNSGAGGNFSEKNDLLNER
jgi:penicillin-binding protein 1A